MSVYFRPLVQSGPRPEEALALAGHSRLWFDHAERLERGLSSRIVPVSQLPASWREALSAPRADLPGVPNGPEAGMHLMGIVNVTPDSFSDGGQFSGVETGVAQARLLSEQGASLIDIGGESTRPGADPVTPEAELARVMPVLETLRREAPEIVISLDTRKAAVAQAGLVAGAALLNDVSALSHDPDYASVAAKSGAPLCLMHAQGDPQTMQAAPHYDDVLLDVYDYLADRVAVAEAAGCARSRLVVDPGIGFGKTLEHNLSLLKGLSLFHGLGCVILLGVSRKRFIGTVTEVEAASERVIGSVAVGQWAAGQGVQILRVHDVTPHRQMLAMMGALL